MKPLLALIFACLTFSTALTAYADVLKIPISQQGATRIAMPKHGDSQQQVIRRFGEPVVRKAAVGQPPITRWDYSGFSVYFEYNTVINSVKNHQAKHPVSP